MRTSQQHLQRRIYRSSAAIVLLTIRTPTSAVLGASTSSLLHTLLLEVDFRCGWCSKTHISTIKSQHISMIFSLLSAELKALKDDV